MKTIRKSAILVLLATMAINLLPSYGQSLVPLDIVDETSWLRCADYKNGRLVMGGSADFPSPTFGVLHGAMILVSDDLGDNSVRHGLNVSGNLIGHVHAVEMLNSSTYLVAGNHVNGLQRTIWRTTNAGQTWSEMWSENNGPSPRWILSIECLGNDCMAVGTGNTILSSGNGGETWQVLAPPVSTVRINEVITADGLNWFISSDNEVLHYSTADGFTVLFSPAISIQRVVFDGVGNILLGAHDGHIFRSMDSGSTWDTIRVSTVFSGNNSVTDCWSDGAGKIYALTGETRLYYSPDDGVTWYWQQMESPSDYDLHFDQSSGVGVVTCGRDVYRVEEGPGNWLPIAHVIEMPDTVCSDEPFGIVMSGDSQWTYDWVVDGIPAGSGQSPTLNFDPSAAWHSIELTLTHNGLSHTMELFVPVVMPTSSLVNTPYFVNDTLCHNQQGQLVLPANVGPTVYEVFDSDTPIAGPFTVNSQDYTHTLTVAVLSDITDLKVRAARGGWCGEQLTIVQIPFHRDVPAEASDFTVPPRVCTGASPIIGIQTREGATYNVTQGQWTQFQVIGNGQFQEVQLNSFNNATIPVSISVTSQFGCIRNMGTYTLAQDSIKAFCRVEPNSVPDTIVKLDQLSWGQTFHWSLPGSDIGESNEFLPQFSYPEPGLYPVTFSAATAFGCVDTMHTHVAVHQQMDWMPLDTCHADTLDMPSKQSVSTGALNAFWRWDYLSDVKRDADGNTYLAGAQMSSGGVNTDGFRTISLFIQKLDAEGNEIWRRYRQGINNNNYWMSMVTGIDLDASGNVYASGVYADNNSTVQPITGWNQSVQVTNIVEFGSYWGWVAKFSSDGDVLWFKVLPVGGGSRATDILYENDSRILVATTHKSSFEGQYIRVFDSEGNIVENIEYAIGGSALHGNAGNVITSFNPSNSSTYTSKHVTNAPRLTRLPSGKVLLSGYMNSNNGLGFGSHSISGGGFVHAVLNHQMEWESAEFAIEGGLFPLLLHQMPIHLPNIMDDGLGNRYMAFSFGSPFSIAGSSFQFGSNGIAVAKSSSSGIEWIYADTLNSPSSHQPFYHMQEITGAALSPDGDGIIVTGNYHRFARFTATNGIWAQYGASGPPYSHGRFINRYDADGNLLWSKNIRSDERSVSHGILYSSSCNSWVAHSQFNDATGYSWTVFTALEEGCDAPQTCSYRSIVMLSDDQANCDTDAVLAASVQGQFDSLRWHMDTGQGFEPLYDGDGFSGCTSDSLTLLTMQGGYFRLTGYHSGGFETHSGLVHFNQGSFLGVIEVEYQPCNRIRFTISGLPGFGFVQVLIDGQQAGTGIGGITLDTLTVPHQIQFQHSGPCGSVVSQPILVIPEPVDLLILQQPEDFIFDETSSAATFSVEATGVASYQWREVSASGVTTDLTDLPSVISGSQSPQLTIHGFNNLMEREGSSFRARLEDENECHLSSSFAQLVSTVGIPMYASRGCLIRAEAGGDLSISMDGETLDSRYSVFLTDMLGRELFSGLLPKGGTLVLDQPTGIHVVTVVGDGSVLCREKVVMGL
jgi:photosystem II stability/assembly factor-like uncharacterized protein